MTDLKEDDMNPGDRYELIKVKGKGSYGIVGAYKDKKTNKKVAIKRMHKIEDTIDARRMIREIRILHYFRHDNIIDLKRVIYNENAKAEFGDIYLVTNLMDVDLNTLIKKNREELTDDHIQFIVYQIFRGLKFLHSRGIVHRDIKPSNILADENCDIRLCDFGFAREEDCDLNAMTEYVVTRYYRAPEVMLNSQNYHKVAKDNRGRRCLVGGLHGLRADHGQASVQGWQLPRAHQALHKNPRQADRRPADLREERTRTRRSWI